MLHNLLDRKGTILIATYLVLFVIIVVASSFFAFVLAERKSIERETDALKAFDFAEKGIAYAYFESYNVDWNWYTHKWDKKKGKKDKKTGVTVYTLKIAKTDKRGKKGPTCLRPDCSILENGFYAADNGEFMVKAYDDIENKDDTIIVSMGISGQQRRVLLCYLTKRGVYEYFLYSPYDLDLYQALGHYPQINGGGIHTNGNIYISDYVRLDDVGELSTGGSGKIAYTNTRYPAPYYADNYDGVMDAKAPMVRLDQPTNIWRDDAASEAGPFGSYDGDGQWQWNPYAYHFARTASNDWPISTYALMDPDAHFNGSSDPRYDVAPGATDPFNNEIKNTGSEPLNAYNLWIRPRLFDEKGKIVKKEDIPWTQIPAELNQEWNWNKYFGDEYGTGEAASEQPITFYTYDDAGTPVDVDQTWWEINGTGDGVDLLAPPEEAILREQFFAAHPDAKTYWDMFKSPGYWQAIKGDPDWAQRVNAEIFDGLYGDERTTGGTIGVKFTDSHEQPAAWGQFLQDSGLEGVVREGNSGGHFLETPNFSDTFAYLAEEEGIYIGLVGDENENPDWQQNADYSQWQQVLETSIDAAVVNLNDASGDKGDVATKVKFINAFTGKENVVLELDLKKFNKNGVIAKNGVVYSKVPIRLTNAVKLPKVKQKIGFTVVCEENVYLKGEYNNPPTKKDWLTGAVISKKRIFTLSEDFNDPQVQPATEHYRDYPYIYVKDNGSGAFTEVSHAVGGGIWVHKDQLDSDGAADYEDHYPGISDANQMALRQLIDQKDNAYQPLFDNDDPSGTQEATFTWPGSGEQYTYGMMPNKVTKDVVYNCFMGSFRIFDPNHSNKGDILENWTYMQGATEKTSKRELNGSYFVLGQDKFASETTEFVDYTGALGYTNLNRIAPLDTFSNSAYLYNYEASTQVMYDKRFLKVKKAPSDIVFGGNRALWAESTEDFFYQLEFVE